eukprot:1020321-Rhodomonas_salina.1
MTYWPGNSAEPGLSYKSRSPGRLPRHNTGQCALSASSMTGRLPWRVQKGPYLPVGGWRQGRGSRNGCGSPCGASTVSVVY